MEGIALEQIEEEAETKCNQYKKHNSPAVDAHRLDSFA
jgi:hypothetical protein